MKEKSQVADIDRSVYDIRDKEDDAYRMQEGLTPEIIDRLSKEKDDPVWMQQFRLQSLQIYNEMPIPDWGPSIEGLDMDHIATYVRPKTDMKSDWKESRRTLKTPLSVSASRRRSANRLPASVHSTILSSCITTSGTKWLRRASSIPTWRARSRASTPIWCTSIS